MVDDFDPEETHEPEKYFPQWDPTTPPEWAADCWGSVGHDWLDCPTCQNKYEEWLLEDIEDDFEGSDDDGTGMSADEQAWLG